MCIAEVACWDAPDAVAYKREVEVDVGDEDDPEVASQQAAELQTRGLDPMQNKSLASVKVIAPKASSGGPKSGRRPDGGGSTRKNYNAGF